MIRRALYRRAAGRLLAEAAAIFAARQLSPQDWIRPSKSGSGLYCNAISRWQAAPRSHAWRTWRQSLRFTTAFFARCVEPERRKAPFRSVIGLAGSASPIIVRPILNTAVVAPRGGFFHQKRGDRIEPALDVAKVNGEHQEGCRNRGESAPLHQDGERDELGAEDQPEPISARTGRGLAQEPFAPRDLIRLNDSVQLDFIPWLHLGSHNAASSTPDRVVVNSPYDPEPDAASAAMAQRELGDGLDA
jgi:hypothetical protein